MYALGHLGIGIALAWLASYRRPWAVDYRLVLLGAILPDLIDKPLGAALQLESRLWAHTLVFVATVLAVTVIPGIRRLVWVGFGILTHLLLDRIWEQPHVILWPALGWGFPTDGVSLEGFLDILLRDPVVQAGEVAGLVVLVLFARAYGIRSWSSLRSFLRSGRVEHAPAP